MSSMHYFFSNKINLVPFRDVLQYPCYRIYLIAGRREDGRLGADHDVRVVVHGHHLDRVTVDALSVIEKWFHFFSIVSI